MHTQMLHAGWTLRVAGDAPVGPADVAGRDIPAAVPGCVHTDLLAAGLIPDPYFDRNEQQLRWIGRTDWRYECAFTPDAEALWQDRVELVCDGLDTLATVELNGRTIGQTRNMHHPHRFDVKELLAAGENRLTITFASADAFVAGERKRLDCAEYRDQSVIRKMACNFGWDWGPKLTTAGIWRPICLAGWSGARIASVRPLVTRVPNDNRVPPHNPVLPQDPVLPHGAMNSTLSEATDSDSPRRKAGVVDVHVALDRADERPIRCAATLTAPDGRTFETAADVPPGETAAVLQLEIDRPELWWPRGYGRQPLYDLAVAVGPAGAAEPTDTWTGRIGLRTVRLNLDPDEIGSKFVIEINGRAVFCKGANWIPDDCFPSRIDAARYRRRVAQAAEAGMNMLRVWGGGLYESEDFYRACDELGVMVWQDLLFACAPYPEEPPLAELVEAEVRHNAARLSAHPSLVLWCGNNENLWFAHMKDWDRTMAGKTWGAGFYFDLLPGLLAEVDPTRPYWPGSPYSGAMAIDPIDDARGNKHVWDVCKQKDYPAYRTHRPRFVSEFGAQAPATFATLSRAIPPGQWSSHSPAMLNHQKDGRGQDTLTRRLSEHFDVPQRFDDWAYLVQVVQARSIATAVEWWRSLRPLCMGTLYWQLNDCWPVISWASIDGDGRPKPLWYASRRFFDDRLLTIQPDGEALSLAAVNDTAEAWSQRATISRMSLAGDVLAREEVPFTAAPETATPVATLGAGVAEPGDPASEFLVADAGGRRALWFFNVDRDLTYVPPDFAADLSRDGDVHRLRIAARAPLFELCVFADRLDPDAEVNDQLATLLPGESFTFEIRSRRPLALADLTAPPVLQCVNRFGRRNG